MSNSNEVDMSVEEGGNKIEKIKEWIDLLQHSHGDSELEGDDKPDHIYK